MADKDLPVSWKGHRRPSSKTSRRKDDVLGRLVGVGPLSGVGGMRSGSGRFVALGRV